MINPAPDSQPAGRQPALLFPAQGKPWVIVWLKQSNVHSAPLRVDLGAPWPLLRATPISLSETISLSAAQLTLLCALVGIFRSYMKTSSSYMEASIRGAGEALAFLPVGSSIIRAAGACTRAHHQRPAHTATFLSLSFSLPPSLSSPFLFSHSLVGCRS